MSKLNETKEVEFISLTTSATNNNKKTGEAWGNALYCTL